jgi:hypothetical protein
MITKKQDVLRQKKLQNILLFCSLPAHGAGKIGETKLDINETFEG